LNGGIHWEGALGPVSPVVALAIPFW